MSKSAELLINLEQQSKIQFTVQAICDALAELDSIDDPLVCEYYDAVGHLNMAMGQLARYRSALLDQHYELNKEA